MTNVEYARCTCGGNHGKVPVFVPSGTTERWCIIAWNDQFSDCPGCKLRRKNGMCGQGCRECRTHGWHKGRSCSVCDSAPGIGKALDTYVVTPAIWTLLGSVTLAAVVLVVSAFLLTVPFTMMLGEWFKNAGFPVLGWAVIIGPGPVILALVLALVLAFVLKQAIGEFRK